MSACVVAINVFSVGLLTISAQRWEGRHPAKIANVAFVAVQLISICGKSRLIRRPHLF